ncbi:MAG TPA: ABC transporter substrate-binding protein [Vulgatibacter sp.]|nr:ABC transporter substrate-binding protein [Vulgatibacter sp.]
MIRAVGMVLLAALAAGCTRGRTDEQKAADRRAELARAAPTIPAWIDEPWREGFFPPGVDEGDPVPGGTLTVRVRSEPGSLGYLIESDWWLSRIVLHDVNESLIRTDPRRHPEYPFIPELAERWEESPDRLRHVFHLRKGVRWHDGAPFSARDVKFTIDRILDPTVRAARHANSFVDLEALETPDDHTVVFRWRKPYVWALAKLAEIPIYPAHAFAGIEGADFNTAPFMRAPIGTGPFRFESWTDKKEIVLARNDDYWGEKAHVDRVVYRFVSEANVAQQLLMRGEIDIDIDLTSEQYVQVAQERKLFDRYHRVKYFDANYGFINWNTDRPVLSDPAVRNALTMLLDREKIRTTLLAGLDRTANCIFYFDSPACDPEFEQVPYDPPAALRLLAERGWADRDGDGVLDKDGLPLRFTVSIPSGNQWVEQALLVYRQTLTRVGIEMEVQKLEWSVFLARLRGRELDAGVLAWVMDLESDPYTLWHSSQVEGGSNYTGYRNPEVDALIEELRGEFSRDARMAILRRINRMVVRDNPQTLLFHKPRRALVHRRLKGIYVSPIESFQARDVWIDPEWRDGGGR